MKTHQHKQRNTATIATLLLALLFHFATLSATWGCANGTTVTALDRANGIKDLDLIHSGQMITIPH